MTQDELLEDGESIAGLEPVGDPEDVQRSKAWTFTFAAQELKLRVGQDVRDPATGSRAGELTELDREQRRLVLKRGPSLADVPLPRALIPSGPFMTKAQEGALAR